MSNQKPYAILANKLYVPEQYVTQEILEEYTFKFPFIDRNVVDEYGRPIEQVMEVHTYQYYPSTSVEGVHQYGFQRGNIQKYKRVFKDFEIIDKRANPE